MGTPDEWEKQVFQSPKVIKMQLSPILNLFTEEYFGQHSKWFSDSELPLIDHKGIVRFLGKTWQTYCEDNKVAFGIENCNIEKGCGWNDNCGSGIEDQGLRSICRNVDNDVGFMCETEDVNECKSGVHNCDINANCTNTNGSFTCTCNVGYSGDGSNCQAIRCNAPDRPPPNGIIIDRGVDYTIGNYIRHKCEEGYELVGAERAMCKEDKTWEGSFKCKRSACEDEGHLFFDGKCYFVSDTEIRLFADAEQFCSSRQAELVSINSRELYDALLNYIRPQMKGRFNYYWTSGRYDPVAGDDNIVWNSGSSSKGWKWRPGFLDMDFPWTTSMSAGYSTWTHIILRVDEDDFLGVYEYDNGLFNQPDNSYSNYP